MTLAANPWTVAADLWDNAGKPRQSNWAAPSDLAAELFPGYTKAPHLTLIDQALIGCLSGADDRVLICVPPQSGKSTTAAEAGPLWWLHNRPADRVVVASYAAELAEKRGRRVRNMIRDQSQRLNLTLTADSRATSRWDLTSGGGMLCMGVSGGLTGNPADLAIVDDPHKDRQEASSRVIREAVWDWWTSTLLTRIQPGGSVILIMCMTGDTPVLMSDGAERPLRDIRPGDAVATYENGRLTSATVRNWANQGPDTVYRIRMKSGTTVRANARHPFLTIQDGVETWQRTDALKMGSRIRRATGANGAMPSAPSMPATSQQSARACACRTTTSSDGQTGSAPHRSTPSPAVPRACVTGTGSTPPSTTGAWPSKAVSAPSASSRPHLATLGRTGTASSASTTTTTPALSEACCATTATWPSATERPKTCFEQPLTTYAIEADEVVEVVICGVEDVYDIQVDRTENFIANGLVSHNTRWDEDDLAARVLDLEGDKAEGGRWRSVVLPALSEADNDPLGREPGDPLTHPKLPAASREVLLDFWETKKREVGSRDWPALYQQRPAPIEGAIWKKDWLSYIREGDMPQLVRIVVGVDPASTSKATSDMTGIVVVGVDAKSHGYVLDDRTVRGTPGEWGEAVWDAFLDWDATEVLLEKPPLFEAGQYILQTTWPAVSKRRRVVRIAQSLPIRPVDARVGKRLRAEPVATLYEQGMISHLGRLPDLEEQMLTWAGDGDSPDRVDALVHACTGLFLDHGKRERLVVPARWAGGRR